MIGLTALMDLKTVDIKYFDELDIKCEGETGVEVVLSQVIVPKNSEAIDGV